VTKVDFHTNTADKVLYACRLVRKAAASGARVVVTGEPALLRELDTALWTFAATEFVPHCHADGASPQVLAASPVVLSGQARTAPHQDVLVNLGPAVPDGFERFNRLIEVVAADDADRADGRRRWKHYSARGYGVENFDRSAAGER
jgi:DNA polymerase-3 subunit chi